MSNLSEIKTINVHELKKIRDENPSIYLIDVREMDEWNTLHIPGAIHIQKDTLTQKIDNVITDKDQPIYLYCHSGKRSLGSAEDLHGLGYTDLYTVSGGVSEWAMFGYPVEVGK